MTKTQRYIFDSHVRKEELLQIKFGLMGQLLRRDKVKGIVDKYNWQSLYIYGGGYLGLQAYDAFGHFIDMAGIIDQTGELLLPRDDIDTFLPQDLAKLEDDLPIIITPLEYACAIRNDLLKFRSEERIYYLNELF